MEPELGCKTSIPDTPSDLTLHTFMSKMFRDRWLYNDFFRALKEHYLQDLLILADVSLGGSGNKWTKPTKPTRSSERLRLIDRNLSQQQLLHGCDRGDGLSGTDRFEKERALYGALGRARL